MQTLKYAILAALSTVALGSQELSERGLNRGTAERYRFSGQPRWQLSELLTSRTVSLNCSEEFQVYTGRSDDEIDELYRNGASSWCSSSLSWDSWFVKGHRKCEVTISPFGETIVTVVPEDAALKYRKLSCAHTERSELSLQLLASGIAGLVLFYTAPILATSVAFRVSVGGTLSVFLCTLIIAIYFFRRMKPGNTALSLAAGLSTLGVSATGLAKLWFRFPDTPSLLTNRVFLVYALSSFLIGAAVWYYFDNADGKIIDILAVGLRLLGVGLVFYSCSQVWEAGTAVVCLLVATVMLHQKHMKSVAQLPATPATGESPLQTVSPPALHLSEFTPPMHTDTSPAVPAVGGWRTHPGVLHYGDPGSVCAMHAAAHCFSVSFHCDMSVQGRKRGPGLATLFLLCFPVPQLLPDRLMPLIGAPPLASVRQVKEKVYEWQDRCTDGFVKNSLTGRLIKVHGGTYQSLLEKGFTLDRISGSMLPPTRSPDMVLHDAFTPDHSNARRRPSRQSSRRHGISGTPVRGSGNSSVTSPY